MVREEHGQRYQEGRNNTCLCRSQEKSNNEEPRKVLTWDVKQDNPAPG
jgi:hypothetical protein